MAAKMLLLLCLVGGALAKHNELPEDFIPSESVGMKVGKYPPDSHAEMNLSSSNASAPALYIDIFPPKYKPGEALGSNTMKEVNRALDEVLKSSALMHDRSCAIGTANEGPHALVNPRYWLYSGMAQASPAPIVEVGQTGLKLFVKKNLKATGTVGVVTYDLEGTDFKVAIMWSVPFDFNIWDVWFNVKVYPKSKKTDEHLYNQMYYYAGPWRSEGWETREEYGVRIVTAMTENIHAKLQVYVNSEGFDPKGSVELEPDCSYHAGWVKHYCWKECHYGGYCWINQRCSSKSDCLGDMPCYEKCKKTGS